VGGGGGVGQSVVEWLGLGFAAFLGSGGGGVWGGARCGCFIPLLVGDCEARERDLGKMANVVNQGCSGFFSADFNTAPAYVWGAPIGGGRGSAECVLAR